MTVSAWVNTASVDIWARVVATRWTGGGNKNYWLGKVNDTTFNFDIDNNTEGVSIAFGLINDGAWHHVVGVADVANSLLRLYVDGNQINTAPYDGTSEVGSSKFFIGESTDAVFTQADTVMFVAS